MFFLFLCDYLCVQAHVSSTVYPSAAVLTNVVLAIHCALILAHLQLQIYLGYSLTNIVAEAPDTLSLGYFLVGCHHLLFCLVRTCKNLVEQVREKRS
jgi:hypothetical protein